ncbi:hypothetical protein D9M70_634490 [compost metagenome]
MRSTCGSKVQIFCPVRVSIACTMLHEAVTYMMPSTTSGVASTPRVDSRLYDQTSPSCFTLPAFTWSSLLKRDSA